MTALTRPTTTYETRSANVPDKNTNAYPPEPSFASALDNMEDFGQTQDTVKRVISNGICPPSFDLPLPDSADMITANLLLLVGQTPNPRLRFIYQHVVTHLHALVRETNLTTDEWTTAIEFLTRVGKMCTPLRQEMILLSDVLGVSALVDVINNPSVKGSTESSVLGPFLTKDAEGVEFGSSVASEGKGEHMYVEGRVLTTAGEPVADATIGKWESDENGFYDTQYPDRAHPDCRGRVRTTKDGDFGYRGVVPPSYPIPGDGPVGELLLSQSRHNMRPNHLHILIEAPGYHKLVTVLFPEGCQYLGSDPVFGVKKSLEVKLVEVHDDEEASKRGFPKGDSFKLLKHVIVLVSEEEYQRTRKSEHAIVDK